VEDVNKVPTDMLPAYAVRTVIEVIENPYQLVALKRLEAWCLANIS
jgi:hypothetical protein